jgi:hypothetical protein
MERQSRQTDRSETAFEKRRVRAGRLRRGGARRRGCGGPRGADVVPEVRVGVQLHLVDGQTEHRVVHGEQQHVQVVPRRLSVTTSRPIPIPTAPHPRPRPDEPHDWR